MREWSAAQVLRPPQTNAQFPLARSDRYARRRQPGALAELDGVIYKMRHDLNPTFLFPIVSEVVPCFGGLDLVSVSYTST